MTLRAHHMPFGPRIESNGVRFRLWAPQATCVEVLVDKRDPIVMEEQAGGWREAFAPDCHAGVDYLFRLETGLTFPDPASRWQPGDVFGPSRIVDPGAFRWSDDGWTGRPWHETVIYEAHVGAATIEGSFYSFTQQLRRLRDLGVTAVQLMPLAECPGARNWGYDSVFPYAPNSAYGTPDDLKHLINSAHKLGLMVFVDVVYNHFGPSGNQLPAYAGSFFTARHETPWGAAINFDDAGCDVVRSFFIHNALYWIEEFHVDGLRFDAVHAIKDESTQHILSDIAHCVHAATKGRHVHLVLENDANEAKWLERRADGVTPAYYAAQWNDDAHHAWHVLLTNERDGYYADFSDDAPARLARALAEGFVYQADPSRLRNGELRGAPSAHLHPASFVDFLQNHDQIGNRAFGDRIDALTDERRLETARSVLLLSPHIPMLFMGEEWGARTPFLYFVDFNQDPGLSDAVRDGRRREFRDFTQFAGKSAATTPDPTAPETFEASRLNTDFIYDRASQERITKTTDLLTLRQSEIVPLIAGKFYGATYEVNNDTELVVEWRFERASLRTRLNLSDKSVCVALVDETLIHATSGAVISGARACMAPWSALITKSPPDEN